MTRWLRRISCVALAVATVALLVEWRASCRSTGELTAGVCGAPAGSPVETDAPAFTVSVLSRHGRLDVWLLRIPATVSRNALVGYAARDLPGAFAFTDRYAEPASMESDAFGLDTVSQRIQGHLVADVMDGWRVRFPHWLAEP